MKDELTTLMHEEFIGDEIPHMDLMVMSVCGAIRRGVPKKEALAQHNMSEEYYDANVERVLSN